LENRRKGRGKSSRGEVYQKKEKASRGDEEGKPISAWKESPKDIIFLSSLRKEEAVEEERLREIKM